MFNIEIDTFDVDQESIVSTLQQSALEIQQEQQNQLLRQNQKIMELQESLQQSEVKADILLSQKEQQNEQYVTQINQLKEQIVLLTKEKRVLQLNNQSQLQQLEQIGLDTQFSIIAGMDHLDEVQKEVCQQSEKYLQSQMKQKELQGINIVLRDELIQVRSESDELKQRIQKLLHDNQKIVQQDLAINRLELQNQSYEEQLTQQLKANELLQKENQQLIINQRKVQTQCAEKNHQFDQLNEQLTQMRILQIKNDAQVKQCKQNYVLLLKEYQFTKIENQQLKAVLAKQSRNEQFLLKSHNEDMTESQIEVRKYNSKLDLLNNVIEMQKIEIQKRDSEIKKLKDKLEK